MKKSGAYMLSHGDNYRYYRLCLGQFLWMEMEDHELFTPEQLCNLTDWYFWENQ